MKDFIKKAAKVMFYAVLWVFIFSIKWEGRPLFAYANEILVQNSLVRSADQQLSDFWYRLTTTARLTFNKSVDAAEKPM